MSNSQPQPEDNNQTDKVCSLEYFCEVCEYYPLYPVHGHYQCPQCHYKTEPQSQAMYKSSEIQNTHMANFFSLTLSFDNLHSNKVHPVSSSEISESFNIPRNYSLCCEGIPLNE